MNNFDEAFRDAIYKDTQNHIKSCVKSGKPHQWSHPEASKLLESYSNDLTYERTQKEIEIRKTKKKLKGFIEKHDLDVELMILEKFKNDNFKLYFAVRR